MTNLTARLADILDQHTATMRGSDKAVKTQPERRDPRVLLPADQQRGCRPPRIAAPANSSRQQLA